MGTDWYRLVAAETVVKNQMRCAVLRPPVVVGSQWVVATQTIGVTVIRKLILRRSSARRQSCTLFCVLNIVPNMDYQITIKFPSLRRVSRHTGRWELSMAPSWSSPFYAEWPLVVTSGHYLGHYCSPLTIANSWRRLFRGNCVTRSRRQSIRENRIRHMVSPAPAPVIVPPLRRALCCTS